MESFASDIIAAYPKLIWLLEKFAAPFIALLALGITAWIQIGLGRTTKTRLKLDLFNERFAIFAVIYEINRAWASSKGEEWVGEYIGRMNEATNRLHKFRLLFPISIGDRIERLVGTWHDFTTAKSEDESMRSSPQWPEHVRKLRQLWDSIEEQNKVIRKEIEDFIRIDWKG